MANHTAKRIVHIGVGDGVPMCNPSPLLAERCSGNLDEVDCHSCLWAFMATALARVNMVAARIKELDDARPLVGVANG